MSRTIPHSRPAIGEAEAEAVRQVVLSGHLVQGDVLASLMTVTFNNLKLSTQDKDLSVDPTTLRLFIDAIDWPSLEAANKKMDAVSGNEADAAALQGQELESLIRSLRSPPVPIGGLGLIQWFSPPWVK